MAATHPYSDVDTHRARAYDSDAGDHARAHEHMVAVTLPTDSNNEDHNNSDDSGDTDHGTGWRHNKYTDRGTAHKPW